MKQKFELGQTVMTQGVSSMVESGVLNPTPYLTRHVTGDWGDMCAEDKATNEEALKIGNRIFSSYILDSDNTIWIITEWDRSVTTILLPEEY